MLTRQDQELDEHLNLSAYAAFSDAAKRERSEAPDRFRTAFQRDRDRIVHSKAFRRLMHKTQVFLAPEGDHYRTRLTHTLEVSQIARSIARPLRLNEDLTEAIAMGHDLGHTPFGHTGEEALSQALAIYRGLDPADPGNQRLFRHNLQSLRMVEHLENDGRGLNLTQEVKNGIVCHTGSTKATTLEGQIVHTADRIAYVNHDIDDAIRAGVIVESDLPLSTHTILGNRHSLRITTLVEDMVEQSDGGRIKQSERVYQAMMELRAFLFDNVYQSQTVKSQTLKAQKMLAGLFSYYLKHPEALGEGYLEMAEGRIEVAACDYIASMTDRFAIKTFEELFVPRSWNQI
ncbi:MAG: deoxyguanosinetriphosphate triphosphohydrolase [Coriobacteriales bacterium]|jgi:dGTPase|nr:deoxyguanosinetriphosphate triphosphohydrolase [Coriobacteriales bacterium]